MCGRARCTLKAHQVAQACGGLDPQAAAAVPTQHLDRYRPSYNVSPGAYLPVYRLLRRPAAAAEPVVHAMKWGVIPSFTKKTEKPDHYRMFNARSESIKERASFRRLLPNNRCLVAVEGFYEWKKDGAKKQPYYIHFKGDQPLVFAALYDSWENSEGEVLYTFTILTTRSSSALEWLHDRMPVILRDIDSVNIWLTGSSTEHEKVLRPCEDPNLVWYPVTPAMGKPSFDGPECIKEIKLKTADEKPLSMFFAKKTDVKSESDLELIKSPKQKDALGVMKKESDPEVLEKETKDQVELKTHGIKREPLEIETSIELTEEKAHNKPLTPAPKKGKLTNNSNQVELETHGIKREPARIETSIAQTKEKTHNKPLAPAPKKGKITKNSDDKQSYLLSYFGRR